MTDKKLGVIGGMGSLATKVFFEKIIENTVASKDQDRIDMIILNHATLPDRTKAILEGKELSFLNAVKPDIELLEKAGVENIAIPCNTSHYFYEQMQNMTKVNIINMVRETAAFINKRYGENSKVGILATDGTIATGIYERECLNFNLRPYHPSEFDQQRIMRTIYNIKADVNYQPYELEDMIQHLITNENCSSVILGCTELSSVYLDPEIRKYCVDPMEVLVENSIILSGKSLKSSILNRHHTISNP